MSMAVAVSAVNALTASSFAQEAGIYDSSINSVNLMDNQNEYFEFANPDSRISSNGDFTFEIFHSVTSDTFKFSKTKATITVSAVLKDYIDGSISDGSNHKCTLKLYKGGILANSFDFYADGETYTFDVVGLDVTKNYSISVHNTSYTSNQRLRVPETSCYRRGSYHQLLCKLIADSNQT